MGRIPGTNTVLKHGDVVKCCVETSVVHKDTYYIINKHSGGHIWVDNIQGVFWPDTYFELDDYCIKHNNPTPRKEIQEMTGARKDDTGKMDYSLIPLVAMDAEAKAFMVGLKYGRYNYCGGMEAHRVFRALIGHAYKWFNGEENDSTDGQPHLGSVRACCAMLLRMQELGTLIDNRYKPQTKESVPCPQQLELPLTSETPKLKDFGALLTELSNSPTPCSETLANLEKLF